MSSVHSREYQELLRRLRRAREEAGLTQVQVARKLRRPQSFVSKIEFGERRVDVIELRDLLSTYGVDVAAFLKGCLRPKGPSR